MTKHKNKFLSKKTIMTSVFICSFVSFIFSFTYYIISTRNLELELKKVISDISLNISEIHYIDNKINSIYAEQVEKVNLEKKIESMASKYYTYKTKNAFIDNFSKVLKQNRNISVQRVEYSKSELKNNLKINLTIVGTYSEIRSFIYNLEKTFCFSTITSIGMDKSEFKIKANIEITTFLGDD